MTSLDFLKHILNEQVEGYRSLLSLLQKERAYLVDFDAEAVERLSKEKDTLVLKLRLLEEERKRLVKKIATEMSSQVARSSNGEENDMSINRLYEITGDNTLPAIRLKLISLLQGIEELNEFNRVLIERSLTYIRNTSDFFGSLGLNCKREHRGTMISKET